jgi:hypothetical protein
LVQTVRRVSQRRKLGARGQLLRGSTRKVRDKAMCKRASVEEVDKASQRRKLGARGQLLRTRKVRDKSKVHTGNC